MVEEEANVPRVFAQVANHDAPEIDRPMEVDRIGAGELEPEVVVDEANVADEGVRLVAQRSVPGARGDPGEFAVGPDPEPKWIVAAVVPETDMGKVDVADLIVRVERDEKTPIADG